MVIVKYGQKILRKVCRELRSGNFEYVEEYYNPMVRTLRKLGGVGLAAPQIGINRRFFVVDYEGKSKFFMNPKIEKIGEVEEEFESCLSIPGISVPVPRSNKIKVTYFNDEWEQVTEVYTGMMARIIQHEYDHLDGILIIDYLSKRDRKELEKDLDKISKSGSNPYGGGIPEPTRDRGSISLSDIVSRRG